MSATGESLLPRGTRRVGPARALGAAASRALAYDRVTAVPRHDGLTLFSAAWAVAQLFSLAEDRWMMVGDRGLPLLVLGWAAVGLCCAVLVRPRVTALLAALAAVMVALYVLRLPVPSNNKTISFVMNLSLLLVLAAVWLRRPSGAEARARPGADLREVAYERARVAARALLAVMYFYGIFHKVNTDFLHPEVSCAVALYVPLAAPFGLEDNLVGRYGAIWATFVLEAIAIVALYWRRWFAVGLVIALAFHYVIPISGYSWYMDFSSLVFALYLLSVPKQVSGEVHDRAHRLLHPVRGARLVGRLGPVALGLGVLAGGVAVVSALSLAFPGRQPALLYHSVWMLAFAAYGGAVMVALTAAALRHLPHDGPGSPRQPAWVFALPAVFFVSCLSPYVGLKTDSAINMYSNLHTEGGETNHLLLPWGPPYLFDYQRHLVRPVESSDPRLQALASEGQWMVRFAFEERMRRFPAHWATVETNAGERLERVTAATLGTERPSLAERKFLMFKDVDFDRPKVCTH